MYFNRKKIKPHFANFAVILAIMADLLFPKIAVAGAAAPEFKIPLEVGTEQTASQVVNSDVRLPRAEDVEPRKIIYVTVTAYSSTPDQTDDSPFITANGARVHNGTLAANFLPFGAKVRLPDYAGDKIFVVEDRMHPRFSRRADIWMETREAAVEFGVKRLKMEIY